MHDAVKPGDGKLLIVGTLFVYAGIFENKAEDQLINKTDFVVNYLYAEHERIGESY